MAGDEWSDRAEAWSEHWPRLSEPARLAVAEAAGIGPGMRVLDAGCGSGELCALAVARGARVSGIDAAAGMLAIARARVPHADLRQGDIRRLPWDDGAFDLVTAFNAVQFTGDVPATIAELARVGHRVAIANWAQRSDLGDLFAALSEPETGAGGDEEGEARRQIGRPGVLEALMRAAGLEPEHAGDVDTPYETPELATLVAALRDGSGFDATEDEIARAAAPYRRADGSYRFQNRFRYVVATRS